MMRYKTDIIDDQDDLIAGAISALRERELTTALMYVQQAKLLDDEPYITGDSNNDI